MPSDPLTDVRWLFGIGFEKCGTTFLEAMLRNTPGFCAPRNIKETVFFAFNFNKGFDWFLDLFSARQENDICVEFTPYYIRDDAALARIAAFSPGVKIIINLRNPVYRAFSHYWHNIYNHHCLYNITTAEARVPAGAPCYAKTFYDEFDKKSSHLFTQYHDLVLRAISRFGRENVLILVLERDFTDPAILESKLRTFLGIDLSLATPGSGRNNTQTPWVVQPSGEPRVLSLHDQGLLGPHDLGIVRNGMVTRLLFQTAEEFAAYLRGSARWTRYLSAKDAKEMYDRRFRADVARLEGEVGQDLSSHWAFHDMQF